MSRLGNVGMSRYLRYALLIMELWGTVTGLGDVQDRDLLVLHIPFFLLSSQTPWSVIREHKQKSAVQQ